MGYDRKNKKIALDPNSRIRLWARRLKFDLPCLSLTARGDAESNSSSGNGIAQFPFFVKRRPHLFLAPRTPPRSAIPEPRAVYPAHAAWIAGTSPATMLPWFALRGRSLATQRGQDSCIIVCIALDSTRSALRIASAAANRIVDRRLLTAAPSVGNAEAHPEPVWIGGSSGASRPENGSRQAGISISRACQASTRGKSASGKPARSANGRTQATRKSA